MIINLVVIKINLIGLESISKIRSAMNSRNESQEFIRLKDPTDNEDIIIKKKRSDTMNYEIDTPILKPHESNHYGIITYFNLIRCRNRE